MSQSEVQRRQDESELVSLRERERQLAEELNMRRVMDSYTQRQMYQLIKGEQELRRVNQEQLDELERLSAKLRNADSIATPVIAHYLLTIMTMSRGLTSHSTLYR